MEVGEGRRRRLRILISHGWQAAQFERFRAAWIAEYRRRLLDLKSREQRRHGRDVDGMTVERHLTRLMRLIRPKRSGRFRNWATPLSRRFGREGLAQLYLILDDIIEEIPWRADWGRIAEETYRISSESQGDSR